MATKEKECLLIEALELMKKGVVILIWPNDSDPSLLREWESNICEWRYIGKVDNVSTYRWEKLDALPMNGEYFAVQEITKQKTK